MDSNFRITAQPSFVSHRAFQEHTDLVIGNA